MCKDVAKPPVTLALSRSSALGHLRFEALHLKEPQTFTINCKKRQGVHLPTGILLTSVLVKIPRALKSVPKAPTGGGSMSSKFPLNSAEG